MEFVTDGVTGSVCPPEPEALALAVDELSADRARASRLGAAGFARPEAITWDGAIDALVGAGDGAAD